jgi:thioredoxin-like negative regulator of GroEL
MADILNHIAKRYGTQVKVVRVDIIAHPEVAKAEMVSRPPKVVMMAAGMRACKFEGLWTQSQVGRKVDELLHGLERVGRDRRPEVKGMRPVGEPAKPAKP